MKKGIALLIALFFIMVIIGIVSSMMGIYNKYAENGFYTDMSQNSVLIQNVEDILGEFSKEVNSSDDLSIIFGDYPVTSKNGDFKADITITPVSNKVNINEIGVSDVSVYIQKYLINILNAYEVVDPRYFLDLVLDTVDKDTQPRNVQSEIINTDPSFINGRIYSYTQFKRIMDYYYSQRQDANIYKIPWKKLIYFGDVKKEMIDSDNISDKNAKYLGIVFKGSFDYDEAEKNAQNRKIMKILDIMPFSKSEDYFIDADVVHKDQNITIIYNISKKKVKDIECRFLY